MTRQFVTRWIAVANDSEHHCIHYGNPNNGLSYQCVPVALNVIMSVGGARR